MTLLEFLLHLFGNSPADLKLQQDFAKAPEATLVKAGLADLSAADVHDALVLVQDTQTVDFGDSHISTGGNTIVGPPAPHFPVPTHEAAHDGPTAVEYLQHYVSNTEVQDADTTLGSPVKQVIHAGDDVDQHITSTSTAASGDGAVAAGGPIAGSTVTTGDGNVFGSGNQVGDGNTGSFGAGSHATSASFGDTTVAHGGALSVAGPAGGTESWTNSGNTTQVTTDSHTEITDSYHTDTTTTSDSHTDSHDVDITNSGNHTDTLSHNTVDVTA
jgi:hypothetical protein